MKSYLLTGARGFIGSHLGSKLKALGNTVFGLDNEIHSTNATVTFRCDRADVRDADYLAMRAKNVDTIIHLAALINVDFSAEMPESVFDVNLTGTLNVLEVARRFDKKVVFASTSEVYGTYQIEPSCGCCGSEGEGCCCAHGISETHALDGQSPYAASKIAADRACKAWKDAYGMDINVLRLFNTFGPHQADDGYGGVIARFTRQALNQEPMTIFGNGDQKRDYLYVDDAVNAYLLACEETFDGPINFGSGQTITIMDLARKIHELVNPSGLANEKAAWLFEKARPGEVHHLECDSSKANAMGWYPTVPFEEGLRRYVNWARGGA